MDEPIRASAPLLGEPLPVELMNTIWADARGGHDELADREQLRRWLAAIAQRPEIEDLKLARLRDASALTEFRALRDALRVLAARITADTRPIARRPTTTVKGAVGVLNRAGARAPSWPELAWPAEGPTRRSRTDAAPLQVALARIAGEATSLFSGGVELRACQAPGCVLYFVRSHPRREWCSAGCGNRARVARHYARHHGPRG